MTLAEINNDQSLDTCMTEPSPALVAAVERLAGRVIILGGSGKMGPELAAMLHRADIEAGVDRDVVVASTFNSNSVRKQLAKLGVRCLRTDLSDPDQLCKLPDAPNVVHMLGFKFGSSADYRRAFHINGIVPYLVGHRYPDSAIVVFSSTNPYEAVPYGDTTIVGSREQDPLGPHGIYGWSVVARESAFATTALTHPRQRICYYRLAYSQHLAYGVLRDMADMILRGEPISLDIPAVNLISQRDAIDYALRSIEHATNPAWTINVAGPIHRVKAIAFALGKELGREPNLMGTEGDSAPVADDQLCRESFGEPRDDVEELIGAVSRWVRSGGVSWNRPTKFGSVNRSF